MLGRLTVSALVLSNALAVAGLFRDPSAPIAEYPARPQFLNPLGVAVDPTGATAYVVLGGVQKIAVVDLAAGKVLRHIATGKSPRAIVYHLGALFVADAEKGALVIPVGDVQGHRLDYASLPEDVRAALLMRLPPWFNHGGRSEITDEFAVSPALQGRHSAIAHESAEELLRQGPFENSLVVADDLFAANRTTLVQTPGGAQFQGALGFAGGNNQSGGWGSERPIESDGQVIRLEAKGGAALPSGVLTHTTAQAIFVAATGSDSVLQLNAARLRSFAGEQRLSSLGANGQLGCISVLGPQGGMANQFVGPPQPADYVVQRFRTQSAPGPMALSADGRILVVANVLADSLTLIECRPTPRVVRHIPLDGPAPDAARRGEILFHSARLDASGQFTCASCHPGGGSDAITWHMPGAEADGRVTKDLHGVRDTAPYGWHGEDATLAIHVRRTLTTLFRHTPTESEISELVAYLESLPPRPPIVDPTTAPLSVAGRKLFEGKAGCVRCHKGATLDDGKQHDVATGGTFDTPSLRGVGNRTKLLHDGRAGHIVQALNLHQGPSPHAVAVFLTNEEITSLIAYLKSL
jgi:hypothetical protein